MWTISKEFAFEASHQLTHLPDTHKCSRHHGHSYRVKIELTQDRLDECGFVMDYAELDWLKDHIDRKFDHRDLNEVMGCPEFTTAEFLARHFSELVQEHLAKTLKAYQMPYIVAWVSETQKTWAKYADPVHAQFSRFNRNMTQRGDYLMSGGKIVEKL